MSWIQVWCDETEASLTCFLNLMMYELGTTSALDDERMGAESPWMVSKETFGAAAAQAASERATRPLMVTDCRAGTAKSMDRRRLQETDDEKAGKAQRKRRIKK